MRTLWILLLGGGLIVLWAGLNMPVSGGSVGGYGEVVNADLLAQRSDQVLIGCTLLEMAAMVFAADAITLAISGPRAVGVSKAEATRRSLKDLAKDDNRGSRA